MFCFFFQNLFYKTMVSKLFFFTSIIGYFCVIEMTTAMFFTNSKENEYPRIGKRPVSFLSKRRKSWERDARFDVPGLRQRMAEEIDDMLNYHGSEGIFLMVLMFYVPSTTVQSYRDIIADIFHTDFRQT